MRIQSLLIGLCGGVLMASPLASFVPAAAAKAGKAAGKANNVAKPKRPLGPIIEERMEQEAVPDPEPDVQVPEPEAPQAAEPQPKTEEIPPSSSRAADAELGPEALRARYDELRDEVFRSRARRETVEQALFSTKVGFELHWQANRKYRLDKAELRLDGTRIWDAKERPVTEEPITLAKRPAAPGTHMLTVRFEVRSRDKVSMGYTSEQNFHVAFPEGKLSRVRILIDEGGNLPSYNPEVQIKLESK